MNNFISTLLLLAAVTGCSATPKQTMKSGQPQTYRVMVKPYRMPPIIVPISREGATLRSTVCAAYDAASRNGDLAASYLISQQNITGLTEVDLKNIDDGVVTIGESSVPGEKFIVLLRAQSRMFFSEDLVFHSDLGSIRVLPGDRVITLPIGTVLEGLFVDSSTPGQYVAQVVGKDVRSYATNAHSKVSNLYTAIQAEGQLTSTDLTPNVIVLTRTSGLSIDTLIVPSPSLIGSNFELVHPNLIDRLVNIPLSDGDVVEFTRLETIPIVALGMTLPAPPGIVGVTGSAPQPTCGVDKLPHHALAGLSGSTLNPLRVLSAQ